VDLVVAVVLGFLATRSTPSRVEVEALDVRRKAVQAMGGTFSLTRLVIPMLRIVANMRRPRRD
jgi:membrane protein YdbS with pleckstrin-like domain